MDWYYPVLSGAITGVEARHHLAERLDEFVGSEPDGEMLGVRCVSDKDWATAAETAECAMAHLLVSDRATALDLFQATMPMRRPDGHYLTGIVYPGLVTFPASECSTYTAAAVILAADAIGTCSPASDLFVNHSTLHDVIDVEPLLVDADHEGPFRIPERD